MTPKIADVFLMAVLAAGCSFSPSTSGSIIDCSGGKPCPEGWYCPSTVEKICVQGAAGGDDGAAGPDGGSGPGDTGARDTGRPVDTGIPDAGGLPDTDVIDDGDAEDAGTDDAGAVDAGPADAGDAGPCGRCDTPPKNICLDARTLTVYDAPGTCGGAACAYTTHTQDCPYGCGNGACVNCTPDCGGKECSDNGCGEPCGQCDSPPSSSCVDGSTLRTYPAVGSCPAGSCTYPPSDITCPHGCTNAQCKSCAPDCGGKECGSDGCGGSCGACGGNQGCSGGRCVCTGGYDDCDGSAGNGCEANLQDDPENCATCGRDCATGNECTRGKCIMADCYEEVINEGRTCGGQGNCHVCRSGSCDCNTPHYECPSCLPSCGVLKGSCCPDTGQCDAAGEKGASYDCYYCCAGSCIPR